MQSPVTYAPSIEMAEPDEDRTVADLKEALNDILETTADDYGHAVRSVHAKSHAILRARLTVLDGLAADYAQGLFARPAAYDAVMRFSTNPGDVLHDGVSVPRGLAVKVLGVDGARLPGSEEEDVQDFVLANGPVFAASDPKKFLSTLRMLEKTTNRAEWAKRGLSTVMRGAEKALETLGGESATLQTLGGAAQTHPLGETYHSQAAFRYGDWIAKFAVAPVSPELQRLAGTEIDVDGRRDALREEMNAAIRRHGGVWEMQVQLCRDPETMPVEDPTVLWSEDESPFVAVARLSVEPQTAFEGRAARDFDDRTRFSPWSGLAAHEPLGGINRARRETYEMSASFRERVNGCPIRQPRSLDALPLPAKATGRGPLPARRPTSRSARVSPLAGLALASGALALAALLAKGRADRRAAPRPPDDADPRLREDGDWRGRFAVAGKSVLIAKPRAEVYDFWRDLSNQSRFMENVEAVRADGTRSTWTLRGLAGHEVEVEVDLTEERENERLAWASVPGSQIETNGQVTFRDAPAGRGTYVELVIEYVPPAGALGRAVANLTRRSPQLQARHGLKRLKMLMEAGEVATSARTRNEHQKETT